MLNRWSITAGLGLVLVLITAPALVRTYLPITNWLAAVVNLGGFTMGVALMVTAIVNQFRIPPPN